MDLNLELMSVWWRWNDREENGLIIKEKNASTLEALKKRAGYKNQTVLETFPWSEYVKFTTLEPGQIVPMHFLIGIIDIMKNVGHKITKCPGIHNSKFWTAFSNCYDKSYAVKIGKIGWNEKLKVTALVLTSCCNEQLRKHRLPEAVSVS